jgi:two-component system, OmpR family, sensor histidine kinase BaeS
MKSLSIRTKFIMAFIMVGLVAIALVGVFTTSVSNQQFQNLVLDRFKEDFTTIVVDYYETTGTLLGIEKLFRPSPGGDPTSFESFARTGIILALPNGGILVGDETHPAGTFLKQSEISNATLIVYEDTTIAYLVTFDPPFQPNPQEARFIERTNKAMLYASLIAIALAVIMGLIFTQALLRPLSNLNTAISNMEHGELQQEVPKKSNDELGKVIEGFNQMSVALASANTRRDQMTADIAHELRSPLTVINGYLEAMRDGTLEVSQERLMFIQDEVNQLNRLVNDLRTLALADAGQLDIKKDLISINNLFKHLENAYSLMANGREINLSFSNLQNKPMYADEGRILQVISNLLNNALRHTKPNGSIHVIASGDLSGNTIIQVSDTGEGIPEEDLPVVFDRFYRVDPSRETLEGESGLGLSIVKAIVEAHQGTVEVKSEVDEGTTFTIMLPGM